MTPWELAKISEHSQQRALFAWANCAAMHGYEIAADPRGYAVVSREEWSLYGGNYPKPQPVPVLNRLFAIHNQGHGDAIRGGKAKAEGVKAGVPDLMLPYGGRRPSGSALTHYRGLFIELKRDTKANASAVQHEWLAYLNDAGYKAIVCYGWQHAASAIQNYLEGKE